MIAGQLHHNGNLNPHTMAINPSGSRILTRILRAGLVPPRRRPLVQMLEPGDQPELLALHLPSVSYASAPIAWKDV